MNKLSSLRYSSDWSLLLIVSFSLLGVVLSDPIKLTVKTATGEQTIGSGKFLDPKGGPIEWWQTGVIYQVYPRSFKDSDGDGIGDLKGIKLMLDYVPNHTSDEHEWFKKSVKKIEPYTDYYVWRDPKEWKDGKPIEPNNWISNFTGPAWTYNEERKQFYYHIMVRKQPDLNFRNKLVQQEMVDILKFWMDLGVDGFRIDSVQFLVEHSDFKDEPIRANYDPIAESGEPIYNSLDHIYILDQPESYEMVQLFQKTISEYNSDFKSRVMVTEAYTTLSKTLQYYVGNEAEGVGMNMPFNFMFIRQLDGKSTANQFEGTIHAWMDNMPKNKWANWVSSNHDNPRATKRFGEALVDGINMLILLLPGTAFTYYGEEIGMQDTETRWDQTVDPQGVNVGPLLYDKFTRDPCRTPFQWDASISSGFSKSHKTWLPVNPNYWQLNVENQKRTPKSHYNVYKRMVHLRNTNPTIQRGSFVTQTLSDRVLILIRELENHPTFAVVINIGSEEAVIDLENIPKLPSEMYVHTSSVNSEHETGDLLGVFRMRPKSSLVLTNDNSDMPLSEKTADSLTSSSAGSTILPITFFSILFSVVLIYFF